MEILVLESNSGQRGIVDPHLFPEGFAMLKTFVDDFKESGFEVITTLNPKFEKFKNWINADKVLQHDELEKAINLDPDAAFVIAPEGELELITRRLKRNDIPVLGSDEEVIGRVGNKWETYKSLKARVPQPETWDEYPENENHLVSKPKFGVGAEDVEISASEPSEDSPTDFIFQREVDGIHASCCLLMGEEEGQVLSVNEQRIVEKNNHLEYRGGTVPIQNKNEKACKEIALKSARKMDLKGYCGVDLVIGDENYLMELNPRVTTSFVGLDQVLKMNLGELLVKTLIEKEPIPDIQTEGCSVIRIPRICEESEVETENLEELKQIPEIFAPPYLKNGSLKKDQPILLATGTGRDFNEAEKKVNNGIRRALEILRVDVSRITGI